VLVGVHLCPPAGVYMNVQWERVQGNKGRKKGPVHAVVASSIDPSFSDYNDIIFCYKTHTEQTIG